MNFLPIRSNHVETLEDPVAADGDPCPKHHFEPRQLMAINAALSANRPLLVRGEPGIGKTQLARAAAKALRRAFVQCVVDAKTESRDLLWHFDAIGRLAEAQVLGALHVACPPPAHPDGRDPAELALAALRQRLELKQFIHPRALWWAFDWPGAKTQADHVGVAPPPQTDNGDPRNGCVVLIDEIDKAESDVPNGLLEALGAGSFTPQGCHEPVKTVGVPPLVIITTNEERALPDAFVRRCLVLHLKLPDQRAELIAKLVERGQTHFGAGVAPKVLQAAAEMLADDRAAAEQRHWRPLPGQAEYLDLVRGVVKQAGGDFEVQQALIAQVGQFVLKKHPDAAREQDAGLTALENPPT
ncbi:AAA family ATPase [Methylomonas sp. MED-D]|uniref:AAA family ATPase n=1 Tax=unclassified Methylomonas TaxID=2608980 RepID=UPI0028A5819B|nr:AAA family ATPase [Methylomonas sp. MV1]MDT4331337.1 AAA family ATPase [Methylomonas sp. MV1]